jgi:hypothetical protein
MRWKLDGLIFGRGLLDVFKQRTIVCWFIGLPGLNLIILGMECGLERKS